MRRLAMLLCLSAPAFAAPVLAQDADPANQITEGVLACLSGGGDVDLTGEMLDAMFWSNDGEGEEGLFYFTPGAGEDTFIYMAGDGSFCHVESMVLDSATTSEILAATLEDRQRRRFSPVHVAARLAQVDAVAQRAADARAAVQAQHDGLAQRLAHRLWLPPALADGWLGAHREALATLASFSNRLAATRAGFAAHPVDDGLPAITPAPVTLAA